MNDSMPHDNQAKRAAFAFPFLWSRISATAALTFLIAVFAIVSVSRDCRAGESVTVVKNERNLRIAVPVLNGKPMKLSKSAGEDLTFTGSIGRKKVEASFKPNLLDQMDLPMFKDEQGRLILRNYMNYSLFKASLAASLEKSGDGEYDYRREYENPYGMTVSAKRPHKTNPNAYWFFATGITLAGDVPLCLIMQVDSSTPEDDRIALAAMRRWVGETSALGGKMSMDALLDGGGIDIKIPPPKGFERLLAQNDNSIEGGAHMLFGEYQSFDPAMMKGGGYSGPRYAVAMVKEIDSNEVFEGYMEVLKERKRATDEDAVVSMGKRNIMLEGAHDGEARYTNLVLIKSRCVRLVLVPGKNSALRRMSGAPPELVEWRRAVLAANGAPVE